MDEEPTGGPDDQPGGPVATPVVGAGGAPVETGGPAPGVDDNQPSDDGVDGPGLNRDAEAMGAGDDGPAGEGDSSPADEIIDLPWDDDLPVALGEETEAGRDGGAVDPVDADATVAGAGETGPEGDDDGDSADRPAAYFAERRKESSRRLDSWRNRSATGAIATAIAMGLQQVFEPEKRRPAAVAEAPSDPYADDDPITVEYVPDDAEATTVHVKPWLLQKGDPT